MTLTEVIDLGGELIHLLSQQRLLYCQLRELAQKQSSLVDGSDPEMLLRILGDRQRLLDRLTDIDRQLQPVRQDWQQISATLPEAQRVQAAELIANVQDILGEIIARDQRDTQALSAHQQQVAQDIRSASAGKRVNQAYAQTAGGAASKYFDTANR